MCVYVCVCVHVHICACVGMLKLEDSDAIEMEFPISLSSLYELRSWEWVEIFTLLLTSCVFGEIAHFFQIQFLLF
jgi:hypothetical protein